MPATLLGPKPVDAILMAKPGPIGLALAVATLTACTSCRAPMYEYDGTLSPDPAGYTVESFPPLTSADFELRVEDFFWEVQAATLFTVRAHGEMRSVEPRGYRQGVGYEWRLVEARLSPSGMSALRQVIIRHRFVELPLEYVDPDVPDLGPVCFTLRAGGVRKTVRAQGELAPELADFADEVWAVVLPEFPSEEGEIITHEHALRLGARTWLSAE